MKNWAMTLPKNSDLLYATKGKFIPVRLLSAYEDGTAVVTLKKGYDVFVARIGQLEMVAKAPLAGH